MLNRMDAPKRFGYTTWRISTINYILSNERYIGDALFQKRYTTDTLPFKLKVNRGQKPQYYVEDMNPPIITKEVFEAAQKLKAKSTTEERFSVQERPLREKIKCGCGHIYKPITVNGKIYWECRMHNFDSQNAVQDGYRKQISMKPLSQWSTNFETATPVDRYSASFCRSL